MTHETNSTWISTTTFFAGLIAGFGTGILWAPQSGASTRRQIKNLAEEVEEHISNILLDTKGLFKKVIRQSTRLVDHALTRNLMF